LWDLQSLKPINIFKGLTGCVTQIALSPDERFLAATGNPYGSFVTPKGANNYFYIWNLEDFTQVVSKVSESPFTQSKKMVHGS
jgi:WD40 repeat protein